jgi:hypothetical protein
MRLVQGKGRKVRQDSNASGRFVERQNAAFVASRYPRRLAQLVTPVRFELQPDVSLSDIWLSRLRFSMQMLDQYVYFWEPNFF